MYVCSSSSSSCCCKTADLYGFFWVVVVVTSFYTFIVFGFIVAFFWEEVLGRNALVVTNRRKYIDVYDIVFVFKREMAVYFLFRFTVVFFPSFFLPLPNNIDAAGEVAVAAAVGCFAVRQLSGGDAGYIMVLGHLLLHFFWFVLFSFWRWVRFQFDWHDIFISWLFTVN